MHHERTARFRSADKVVRMCFAFPVFIGKVNALTEVCVRLNLFFNLVVIAPSGVATNEFAEETCHEQLRAEQHHR